MPPSSTAILGDVTPDAFTVSPGGGGYTYVGTATWPAGAGYPAGSGFLASTGGFTYLFVFSLTPHTLPPTTSAVTTTTPSQGLNGEWTINGNNAGIGCFYAGTLIATPDGERAVETLAAGDLVLTAGGAAKPVVWLGRSIVSSRFADPIRALPIRIKAGALADNVPTRDLLVSPGHAILVDGVLAHAGALVNGISIVRETDTPVVFTYYHLDLATHEIVLADGAPAESFIEGVEDMDFQNLAGRPVAAEAPAAEEMAYPRAKSIRQLPRAIREMLAARAGTTAPAMAVAA